ncbi:hypothetical protein [Nostoc sp. TCL26-01]|uniref:hypothetical protein n=1 Tax=Nostoc sp. TCL26-01 TaxID=2576904 RepID=UPI0015B9FCB7|nr:hypothetical protein [Nostoc sp. TCL26-01]QLE55187.1 hypothetical protein FD725_06485 [Nostoc sp. TCL26-01]
MVIPELEKQLLQLSPNDKLYIIQLLAQSLTIQNTHPEEPTTLIEFFRQSPLVGIAEELDFSRDRSFPLDDFNP